MIDATYQRAAILQQQGRHADAEKELRRGLSNDPHNPLLHAMLALSLSELEQYAPATEEAAAAIGLAPDLPVVHYAMAKVMIDRRRYSEALAAINEAIRLDSYDPDYFSLLSAIQIEQRQWPSALEAANKALELDPQHAGATNLRAMALVQLGRRDEAAGTLGDALSRNPENAITHANEGWRHLHEGNPTKAMEHFRESLRLDPTSEWARAGIVEALKSRNFIYRWMLAYFLWMSRLSSRTRWGIIIGGYLGYRILGQLSEANPHLWPIFVPLLSAYIAFALMTWLSAPLFNLMLRTSKFGKLVLSKEQKLTSELIGVLLMICLGSIAMKLILGDGRWTIVAIVSGLLVAPVALMLLPEKGWPRTTAILIAAGLTLLGSLTAVIAFIVPDTSDRKNLAVALNDVMFRLFLYGTLASQLLSGWLTEVRVRR